MLDIMKHVIESHVFMAYMMGSFELIVGFIEIF